MNDTQKRFLFAGSLFLFFAITSLVMVIAFGYSFDFDERRIIKTGSLRLKSQVGAVVFIDQVNKGETSIFNSFSLSRLKPGKNEIAVQRDGYFSWNKPAQIIEGFLTEYPSIYLVKQEPTISVEIDISKASESFSVNNSQEIKLISELRDKLILQPDIITRLEYRSIKSFQENSL